MKRNYLNLLLLMCGLVLFGFTAPENDDSEFGRECCTVSQTSDDGITTSITACAGWFLSNSENAMERACEKAATGFGGTN